MTTKAERLEAARLRALAKRYEAFELRVYEVRRQRGQLPWEEWVNLAIPLVKEFRELQTLGIIGGEVEYLDWNMWEGSTRAQEKHSPEWSSMRARLREVECKLRGGVGRGCSRCAWRNKGCPLCKIWHELFDQERRGVLVTFA